MTVLFRTVTDALGPRGPRHAPTTSRLTKSGKFQHCKRAKPAYHAGPRRNVATQQGPFVSDAQSHAIKINVCMMTSRLIRLPSSPLLKLVGSWPDERHCQAIFPTPGYHKYLVPVKAHHVLALTLRHRPNSIISWTEKRIYLKFHLHEVYNLPPPPPFPLYSRSRNAPTTLHPVPPLTTDPTRIMTKTVLPIHQMLKMRLDHLLSSVRQNLSRPPLCSNRRFRTLLPLGDITFKPIQPAHIISSRTLA